MREIDYTKYLHCIACQESGLYCHKHRVEVAINLKKRAIMKVLKMKNDDHNSPRYMHAIKGLLESYNVWKTDFRSLETL